MVFQGKNGVKTILGNRTRKYKVVEWLSLLHIMDSGKGTNLGPIKINKSDMVNHSEHLMSVKLHEMAGIVLAERL